MEKNKLPLTFKYIDSFNEKKSIRNMKNPMIYFIKSDKYQTDFYPREKPFKPLTRML